LNGRGYQRYEVRFGPPHTPDVIKWLLIANVGVFILQVQLGRVTDWLGATPADFWAGALWQPLTYMWLHGSLMHLGFNMLALWMFGSPLASAWGRERFLRFYLLCGVGAGLLIVGLPGLLFALGAVSPISASWILPTVGASGAIFGVLLAYSLTWPDRTIMLMFPPIPIKALYFIPFLFALEFLMPGPANVSHVGHLGGVLAGWILFRRENRLSLLPSRQQLLWRWRRYRMRRQLYEVRREQERSWRDNDRRLH
jgi:membrane associated rhomboid family serine protease